MARKKIKISKGSIFARLLLASAILLFIPHQRTKYLNYWFLELFKPVLTFAQGKSPENFKPIFSAEDYVLRSEHEKLHREWANTISRLAKLRQDYERVSKIRKNLYNDTMGIVLADVISATHTGRNEMVIDKGTLDGLLLGQYVLSSEANCVIGTVSDVSESIATVKLITDEKHNLPILVHRAGTNSAKPEQLIGNGDGTASMPLVPKARDILPDDIIYAAKRPGLLEVSIIIGKISEVRRNEKEPLLLDITVKPSQDLTKVQSVVVLAINSKTKYKDLK